MRRSYGSATYSGGLSSPPQDPPAVALEVVWVCMGAAGPMQWRSGAAASARLGARQGS
jgi:hypothetical protein